MHTLLVETRHAFRALRKRPALGAIVVVTLALGLGANAAIFSLVDALVLRPFTLPDVDRVVLVAHTRDGDRDRRETVSPADFLDFRRQTDVFEGLAAYGWWDANLAGREEAERVPGFYVSANMFEVLGVRPGIGRSFLPEEETIGAHRRVILGHGLWQRRFAGDPGIVGRELLVDGVPHEVVGVAPEGFDFPLGAQVWAPLAFDPEAAAEREARYLTVVGRLAPGRSLEEAKAQVAVVAERLAREHPASNRGYHGRAYTLAQGMLDIGLGPMLSLWQASALFVLLIACANVANLLLARGTERQREIAVRIALGARRARVVRELLIESLLLAAAAIPAALLVAWAGLAVLRGSMPAKIARFVSGWQHIDLDGRLFAATALLAVAATVVFGLVPALQSTRPRLAESLKEGGRGASAGASRVRLRRGLVAAEIALALPLLVVAGMSALSVHRYLNGPQGYDPDGVLAMQVALPDGSYPDDDARRRFAARVVDGLAAIPGVEHAAVSNVLPAAGSNSGRALEIDGRPILDPVNAPRADYRAVSPGLFAVLHLPILQGRAFTAADREATERVAIVSASLAREHWPNADPLGRRLRTGDGPWLTVVGVAGDHIHDWFARRNRPTIYLPFAQAPTGYMTFAVRAASRAPSTLAPQARAVIRGVDPAQPVFDVMTLREMLHERTLGLRYVAGVMAVFGGIALVLAVVGVYGVMAYMTAQRTHEIGVRIALGATRGDVLRLTVGQAARLTAIGVGGGIVLSLLLQPLIRAGLLDAAATDHRILAAFAAVLVGAAIAAGYVPARRAAATDPVLALRSE